MNTQLMLTGHGASQIITVGSLSQRMWVGNEGRGVEGIGERLPGEGREGVRMESKDGSGM